MAAARLDGLRVLVTRPAHQAGPLCAAIEAAGGVALRLPLLAIAPMSDVQAARQALLAARDAEAWLFTSVNAVEFAARLEVSPWPTRLAAAGAGTAAALRQLGHSGVLEPREQDGAAGLLRLPEFHHVDGRRLAIIGGERPLPALAQGLAAGGAQVLTVPVYRRLAVEHPAAAVAAALAAADIAVLTSAEALAVLLQLTPPQARTRLLQLPLALPSPRVVEKALEAGFVHEPLVPVRVTDADWLAVLDSWLQLRRPDRRTDSP